MVIANLETTPLKNRFYAVSVRLHQEDPIP